MDLSVSFSDICFFQFVNIGVIVFLFVCFFQNVLIVEVSQVLMSYPT